MIRRRAHSAFSLIEMVAATAIFSVGVLAVMKVFTACLGSASASLGRTRAVLLAQQKIEEAVIEPGLAEGTESGAGGLAYPAHSWKREIESTDQTNLYQVRVVVTWEDRGRAKSYSLATLALSRASP